MVPPYKTWPGLESHALGLHALALREAYDRENNKLCRLSPLIAMSDPIRTPNTLSWVKSLPDSCAVIYRFDKFDIKTAKAIKQITAEKKQQLLIRGPQAPYLGDGRHFQRDTKFEDITGFQNNHSQTLTSLAAIKEGAYKTSLPYLDALLVSSIFPSQSPSAGKPIGLEHLKLRVKKHEAPIYALGGINEKTAPLLLNTGIAGIAAIDGFGKETSMSENALTISKEDTPTGITFKAKTPDNSDVAVLNLSKISEGIFNAHHTGVPKSMGGKGVGTALIKAMSEDAKDNDYKVIPGCPFVATWFKRKPEWADMAEAR